MFTTSQHHSRLDITGTPRATVPWPRVTIPLVLSLGFLLGACGAGAPEADPRVSTSAPGPLTGLWRGGTGQ